MPTETVGMFCEQTHRKPIGLFVGVGEDLIGESPQGGNA
jgi:hypothetical protein